MKKQAKQANKAPQFNRPVEKYFYELDQSYGNSNITALSIGLTLAFFGIMGLIWMIPFPQFDFLVKMNAHTFLNWGSFFYCYRCVLLFKISSYFVICGLILHRDYEFFHCAIGVC